MITRLLIIFGIVIASVYLGLGLREDAGYVLIAIHHWTIETSLWVALLCLLITVLIGYAFLQILWRLTHVSGYWHQRQRKKAIRLADRMLGYQQHNNWLALIDLLPTLKKYKLYSVNGFEQLRKTIYMQFMQELIKNQRYNELKQWVEKQLPKDLKQDACMVLCYATALIAQDPQTAESFIRKTVQRNLDDNLLDLYSTLDPKHIATKNILSLLKKYPNSASLHLCLGRIYMNDQLWGAAQDCLRKSIALRPSAPAYHALGLLAEQLGEQAAAVDAYRTGLRIITQLT